MIWNANGERIGLTAPFGHVLGYSRLATGEVSAVLNAFGETMASFTYDGLGRRTALTLFNGTGTTYAYDPLDRLTSLADNLPGTASDLALGFTRNAAGGIATASRDNDAYAWTGHYAVTRAYTTDGLNRYSAAGSATFTYDANGNLTGDGTRTYTYDIENRLVASSSGASLVYDPLGRLYEVSAGGVTRRFDYDGDQIVHEVDGTGLPRNAYVHGPGTDEHLVWFDIAESRFGTWLADERGSIMASAANTGAAAAVNRYDEYGIPAATNTGRFQYTGQVWLPELGMYSYKARIYSPTLGRFLQTDSIGYEGGINLYAYVEDDPVNDTDPDGTCSETYCAAPDQLTRSVEHADISPEQARASAEMMLQASGRVVGVVMQLRGGRGAGGGRVVPGIRAPGGSRASTLSPGPHARESIPARGPDRNFASGERREVNRMLKEHGCHTCGTRNPGTRSGNAIPDHQPTNALNPPGGPQRLYPHCDTCRRRQAGEVTKEVMRRRREAER